MSESEFRDNRLGFFRGLALSLFLSLVAWAWIGWLLFLAEPGEEPLEGVVERPDSHLQGVDRNGLEPVHIGPKIGDLGLLLVVGEPVFAAPSPALVEGDVIDRPARTDPLSEGACLIHGRIKAIDVGALEQHQTSFCRGARLRVQKSNYICITPLIGRSQSCLQPH